MIHVEKTQATSHESTHGHADGTHDAAAHDGHDAHAKYDPAATAIHHISDANVYTILDFVTIPLPMILYAPDKGWDFFSSSKFHSGRRRDDTLLIMGMSYIMVAFIVLLMRVSQLRVKRKFLVLHTRQKL